MGPRNRDRTWALARPMVVLGLRMVSTANGVHAVLLLVGSFLCAAGRRLSMGLEYMGLLLVVVYMGAIAVLFRFVVMMLDVSAGTTAGRAKKAKWHRSQRERMEEYESHRRRMAWYLRPRVPLVAGVPLVRARGSSMGAPWWAMPGAHGGKGLYEGVASGRDHGMDYRVGVDRSEGHTRRALGDVLYTEWAPYFLVAGLVLLVALLGAVVLTVDARSKDARVQDVATQRSRSGASVVRWRSRAA